VYVVASSDDEIYFLSTNGRQNMRADKDAPPESFIGWWWKIPRQTQIFEPIVNESKQLILPVTSF